MTARKLSKQQKTILVALRELEDFSKEFSMLHRFVLIVTGVDTWELSDHTTTISDDTGQRYARGRCTFHSGVPA